MRIARFSADDGVAYGVVDGEPGAETVTRIAGLPFGDIQLTGQPRPLVDVRLVAPVLPSKIVAVGRNYADHAAELGNDVPAEPLIFLKPSTSVIGQNEPIMYPGELSGRVDYEGELAVIIGRVCRQLPAERAAEVIFGYTCANDVTARDLQKSDPQWTRGKGFDTFCPLGPWITTELDTSDLAISTTLSGEVKQSARTSQFIFGIPHLISYITQVMTLLPGDVILTGTPAGVGPMQVGDQVTVSVDGIGTLTNRVVDRD